jgi:hypothetical protein
MTAIVPPPSRASPTQGGFAAIQDRFETYEQLQDALRTAGMEASDLIVAVDFTKSNTWTGKVSEQGRCLHDPRPDGSMNQYEMSIHAMGKTLAVFDDDNLIPAVGFGDLSTKGHAVFPFKPDGPCVGFEEVLARYRAIVPGLALNGPTNFAPAIRYAMDTVRATEKFHILVIIADGEVTERDETVRAIVEASQYPLSIVVVGVGDGPWDLMEEFDDKLPQRRFDNFQFVDLNAVLRASGAANASQKEVSGAAVLHAVIDPRSTVKFQVAFATAALMEVPDQYLYLKKQGMLSATYIRSLAPPMPQQHAGGFR